MTTQEIQVYDTLREANEARQREWDPGGSITPSFRSNELAGEVGEALEKAAAMITLAIAAGKVANITKKLDRERLGIGGSRATIEDLADELADVIICCDLLAMDFEIFLDKAVAAKFNKTSEKLGLLTRLYAGEKQKISIHRTRKSNSSDWGPWKPGLCLLTREQIIEQELICDSREVTFRA